VADYDRSKPLVIDPVLVYSTYLGGSSSDFGYAITVDSTGNAYLLNTKHTMKYVAIANARRDDFAKRLDDWE
jgi:hypothetical protein